MDLIKKIEDLHNSKLRLKEHMNELAHVTRLGLMGEMASGIAHEVNQPLTAIANYAQVSLNLIKKENPDLIKLAEVISKTQQQALRAGSIIHRMKDFGKSFSKHHATANINTLINDAIELCIVDLKQNGVLLTLELTNNLPPVFVDLIQVEQVIINLIRNSSEALQSLPENQQRKITIQSQLTLENDIQVSVTDNGLGITEDLKQKILMPFFTTKISGTGMGLSISRSLIEAHEGTLNFNSEFGKGTTFYFTLPIETTKREDEGER
jgi:C4-dicarboxylate-specific signal transduction histidine kinase